MREVYNLITDERLSYMDHVSSEFAVIQSYCAENNLSNALLSAMYGSHPSNEYRVNYKEFVDKLPLVFGHVSVACGNWACRLEKDRSDPSLPTVSNPAQGFNVRSKVPTSKRNQTKKNKRVVAA